MSEEEQTQSSETPTEEKPEASVITTTETKEEPTTTEEPEVVSFTREDIKLPEGFEPDEALQDKFIEIMNDQSLDPKGRMQALVDMQAETMKAAAEERSALWKETRQTWANEIKNDPDLGGQNFDSSVGEVAKLVEKYGSNELRDVFDLTGAGDNIHVFRFLHKIAADLNEGGARPGGSPTSAAKSLEERLYPNQGK